MHLKMDRIKFGQILQTCGSEIGMESGKTNILMIIDETGKSNKDLRMN